jgi:hypothetical protein
LDREVGDHVPVVVEDRARRGHARRDAVELVARAGDEADGNRLGVLQRGVVDRA